MGKYARVILTSGVIALAAAVTAAPSIYCAKTEWDFGTISDAASVTHRFLLENRGDSSLLITDVKATCGCTAAILPETLLAPGGTTPLKVIFDPSGREGHQHKTIHLFSNDRKVSELILTVSGHVSPQVVAMPSAIAISAAASDELIERTLTLTYDRPVTIRAVRADSPAVTARGNFGKPANSHAVKLVIDPSELDRTFCVELEIESDHPTVPVKKVPLVGQIKK